MRSKLFLAATIAALAFPLGGSAIGTADLLRQETSLDWLARSPAAGTRLIQFSSYDRSSRVVNGRQVNWMANSDAGNYLRSEETPRGAEWVMAEAKGPGAIVRLWSANPGRRRWRIYIDGAAEPTIEAPGRELLQGKVEPWGPAFSYRKNMGANFYFPILFAKSVKVTTEGGPTPPLMYYHVDLRLYPAGTEVKSFSWAELESLKAEIAAAAKILLEGPPRPEGKSEQVEVELAPGAEGELFRLAGPAAVVFFRVEVEAAGDALARALGQTLLVMDWDGEKGVRSPLGDFFGTSPGANALRSLPFEVNPRAGGAELICRWVMPFGREGSIRLQNLGPDRLKLRAEAVTRPWTWGADSLFFHAGWRGKNRIPTRPISDMRMLGAAGRGHFVGLEMNVRNPLELYWWGEGDEKVWVDDDRFPSIFGTGTEDYFGYAWCVQYFKFTSAFHGVSLPTREWLAIPQAMPFLPWGVIANWTPRQAVVSQYRFQVLDAIPFERKLNFEMEISHHRKTLVDVNAVAYWYAAPGGTDDLPEPDLKRREVWRP